MQKVPPPKTVGSPIFADTSTEWSLEEQCDWVDIIFEDVWFHAYHNTRSRYVYSILALGALYTLQLDGMRANVGSMSAWDMAVKMRGWVEQLIDELCERGTGASQMAPGRVYVPFWYLSLWEIEGFNEYYMRALWLQRLIVIGDSDVCTEFPEYFSKVVELRAAVGHLLIRSLNSVRNHKMQSG